MYNMCSRTPKSPSILGLAGGTVLSSGATPITSPGFRGARGNHALVGAAVGERASGDPTRTPDRPGVEEGDEEEDDDLEEIELSFTPQSGLVKK